MYHGTNYSVNPDGPALRRSAFGMTSLASGCPTERNRMTLINAAKSGNARDWPTPGPQSISRMAPGRFFAPREEPPGSE